jgi:cytochrome b
LAGEGPLRRVRVWDPALRIFHWALAAAFAASWILGEYGPDVMTLHFWSGYLVAGLLAFRLVWGVVGPAPARFATFVRRPAVVAAYLRTVMRRAPSGWPGHNPLGGWSVAALLAVLGAQVATGLVSDPDDFINVGPFAGDVPRWLSRAAVGWHEALSAAALALVALHVAAIAFYRVWKREDLVRPMIDGDKLVDDGLG